MPTLSRDRAAPHRLPLVPALPLALPSAGTTWPQKPPRPSGEERRPRTREPLALAPRGLKVEIFCQKCLCWVHAARLPACSTDWIFCVIDMDSISIPLCIKLYRYRGVYRYRCDIINIRESSINIDREQSIRILIVLNSRTINRRYMVFKFFKMQMYIRCL